MTDATPSAKGRGLRTAVLVLAGAETVLFVVLECLILPQALLSNEAMARSIGTAVALALAAPFLLFTVPALILGIRARWLKLALALAILALASPLALRFLT